ncbi:TPA: hypothetical protein ACXIMP_001410 [Enterobacter asburiae]
MKSLLLKQAFCFSAQGKCKTATGLPFLVDAPRDKFAHFREINGIAAAFQHLQKNYNPTASSFL